MGTYNNVRKEFVFIHEGIEYNAIIDIPIESLVAATKAAKFGRGIKVSSRLYDRTTLNATFKRGE